MEETPHLINKKISCMNNQAKQAFRLNVHVDFRHVFADSLVIFCVVNIRQCTDIQEWSDHMNVHMYVFMFKALNSLPKKNDSEENLYSACLCTLSNSASGREVVLWHRTSISKGTVPPHRVLLVFRVQHRPKQNPQLRLLGDRGYSDLPKKSKSKKKRYLLKLSCSLVLVSLQLHG